MGLFSVGCKVENPADPKKSAVIRSIMVDTGSEFTWIDEKVLHKLGILPRKKDLQIQMANRQIITRSAGCAILHVDKSETTDEVVFAQPGELLLLGCRALEGLSLRMDSRHKQLVAAGPIIAATAVKPQSCRSAGKLPSRVITAGCSQRRANPNLRRTQHHG